MNLMFKCLKCADMFKEIAMLMLISSKTFGLLTLKATLLMTFSTQTTLLTTKDSQSKSHCWWPINLGSYYADIHCANADKASWCWCWCCDLICWQISPLLMMLWISTKDIAVLIVQTALLMVLISSKDIAVLITKTSWLLILQVLCWHSSALLINKYPQGYRSADD